VKPILVCGFSLVVAVLVSSVAVPAPIPPGAKDTPKTELARLHGSWKVISRQQNGVELIAGKKVARDMIANFKEDGTFAWAHGVENLGKVARIDPSKNPKEIDYFFNEGQFKGMTQKGIYKFDGDTYTDCCSDPGEDRPTEFKSTKENKWEIMVFKRIKKDE
jgi:uncharacterized protein (TIGR03067 family)